MPYSFTQIEKDKTKTIGLVFSFLIVTYFLTFLLIVWVVKNIFVLNAVSRQPGAVLRWAHLSWQEGLITLTASLLVAFAHWAYTTSNLVDKILKILHAEPLNPNDEYHKMLGNIIEEVSVATGGEKMEGVIISSTALNAFALCDFEGRKVIGTTEGMLARLSRAQLEAVIGHEAAHIVSGDCLAVTVTTSLFEIYNAILRNIEMVLKGGGRGRGYSYRGGGGGSGAIAVVLAIVAVYALLSVSRTMSKLVQMFVSRQREFRADAVAVRLTRDPMSLSEALYAISYHWRGEGLPAQELDSIFIVSPLRVDVGDKGLFSSWLGTHPPMWKRLDILLNIAHSSAENLSSQLDHQSEKPRVKPPLAQSVQKEWMAYMDNQWQGPFPMKQLMGLTGFVSETWVKMAGTDKVTFAYQDEMLRAAMSAQDQGESGAMCPKCRVPFQTIHYEGVDVERCGQCQGTLVKTNDVRRILIRREVGFSDKITRLADRSAEQAKTWGGAKIDRSPESLLTCPVCNNPRIRLMRMFYSPVYQVEIDKCFYCDNIWFDPDELEVLQCLIEKGTDRLHNEHKTQ